MVNDYLLERGKAPLGFLNPLLYQLKEEKPEAFFDVTSGNNRCSRNWCSIYGYDAMPGWDPASGLGSVDFIALRDFAYRKAQSRYTVSATVSLSGVSSDSLAGNSAAQDGFKTVVTSGITGCELNLNCAKEDCNITSISASRRASNTTAVQFVISFLTEDYANAAVNAVNSIINGTHFRAALVAQGGLLGDITATAVLSAASAQLHTPPELVLADSQDDGTEWYAEWYTILGFVVAGLVLITVVALIVMVASPKKESSRGARTSDTVVRTEQMPPELTELEDMTTAFLEALPCTVEMQGLQSKPELNGTLGQALEFDPELGRFNVALASGETVALKQANLREPAQGNSNTQKHVTTENKPSDTVDPTLRI